MELIDLLKVVRRWLWLIVAVVVVTELALWLGMRAAGPTYSADIRLQVSTPQRDEVALYDEYRSIGLRDEITVAINNLVDLLKSDEVRQRTIGQLGLQDKDAEYALEAKPTVDADFVDVTVEARTPDLAAEIANTHIGAAIAYYGELRAKSTNAEKELIGEQLRTAEMEFGTAEDAFATFQAEHGITSMENELDTYKQLLSQLGLERDRLLLEDLTTTDDPVAEVDKLIAQRQGEMERLMALAPTYSMLEEDVQIANDRYRTLSGDQSETRSQAQIDEANAALLAAEKAFAAFQTENGVFSLEDQLTTQQTLLEQLQLERDQRLLAKSTKVVDSVGEVDRLIDQRQRELDQLRALAPQYNVLAQKAQQARDAYQHLLSKYGEAELKVAAVQAANFIQVVRLASAPDERDFKWPVLAVLALVGSLGLGLVLAFLLEYISGVKAAGETAPASEVSPSDEGAGPQVHPQSSAVEQGPSGSPGRRPSRKIKTA